MLLKRLISRLQFLFLSQSASEKESTAFDAQELFRTYLKNISMGNTVNDIQQQKSIELEIGDKQSVLDMLEQYESIYKQEVESILNDLLKNAENSGIQVYRNVSRVRVLSLNELKWEMCERDVSLGLP